MKYEPCFECLNRYNRDYTSDCDTFCSYAKKAIESKQKSKVIKFLIEQYNIPEEIYNEIEEKFEVKI